MENSICTPQKKEGFRTASKVALKKKGALFGHSSDNSALDTSCGHDGAAHRSRPAAMLLDAGPCGA